MSLNHLVTGGQIPSQNITVNNLTVEGTITGGGGGDTSGSYVPTVGYQAFGGTGGSVTNAGISYWKKTGNIYTVSSLIDFETGIGSNTVELAIELPPGAVLVVGVVIPVATTVGSVTFTESMNTAEVAIFSSLFKINVYNSGGLNYSTNEPMRMLVNWTFESN